MDRVDIGCFRGRGSHWDAGMQAKIVHLLSRLTGPGAGRAGGAHGGVRRAILSACVSLLP